MDTKERKRIALTPVYNESAVIVAVLDRIVQYVDIIVISEDASTDGTKDLILEWMKDHPDTYLIAAGQNSGASAALKKGYVLITELVKAGILSPDDLVIEIDADGQHKPEDMPRLFDRWIECPDADIVLARRDFSNYPFHKIVGNRGLTIIASILSGFRYHDVESNFRVTPAGNFRKLLDYFRGYRYSGAFEVGIILPRIGYRTDNELQIQIPYYRAGASIRDGFHVLFMGLLAWYDVQRKAVRQDFQRWSDQVSVEVVNDIPGFSRKHR